MYSFNQLHGGKKQERRKDFMGSGGKNGSVDGEMEGYENERVEGRMYGR